MKYAEVRSLIKTGDLIALKSPHGIVGKLTQFFTRSEYTHVGVALVLPS